jgi:hypothetical protein
VWEQWLYHYLLGYGGLFDGERLRRIDAERLTMVVGATNLIEAKCWAVGGMASSGQTLLERTLQHSAE